MMFKRIASIFKIKRKHLNSMFRLVRLFTSPCLEVKDTASDFCFILCKENGRWKFFVFISFVLVFYSNFIKISVQWLGYFYTLFFFKWDDSSSIRGMEMLLVYWLSVVYYLETNLQSILASRKIQKLRNMLN